MSKVRTTLTIDESVMKAVKMRAARTGRGDSSMIEESLRRDLGLVLFERMWEHNQLSEEEATTSLRGSTQDAPPPLTRARGPDPNVIISGPLPPAGTPAEVLRPFERGEFELIASQALLEELGRALGYSKLRAHIGNEDALLSFAGRVKRRRWRRPRERRHWCAPLIRATTISSLSPPLTAPRWSPATSICSASRARSQCSRRVTFCRLLPEA